MRDKNVAPPYVAPPYPPLPRFMDHERSIDKRKHALPHWEQGETCLFVTFRLADSIPQAKLSLWAEERECFLQAHPKPWTDEVQAEYGREFGQRLDQWLDAGSGSCVLGEETVRAIVGDVLLRFDGERLDVYAFVVMPNHVHILFSMRDGVSLVDVMKSWKGVSAHRINAHLGRSGRLWQSEYWDRLVRSERHFMYVVRYIVNNPKFLSVPVYLREDIKKRYETWDWAQ